MTSMRQRRNFVKLIQELDAFTKVEEDHQEKSVSGGGLSLVVFGLILVLVVFEVGHFLNEGVQYHYDIDPHYDKRLKLNIDIMVAMKCADVGADILDITGENADKFGMLKEEDVHFEFSPEQQRHFEYLRAQNGRMKEEYHLLHSSLWSHVTAQQGLKKIFSYPKRTGRTNGCRFHGNLEVNKVAGNFHITAGKSITFGDSHMHISFDDDAVMNFSHRIMHLSFGDSYVINPLDTEVKLSQNSNHMWQYFLQVVPTTTTSLLHASTDSYQYAVTEQNRTVSHEKGSHGLPGIYFKYDLSPIRVKVDGGSSTLVQLVVRLCGIVGGIFATSSFLHLSISGLVHVLCCKWAFPPQQPRQASEQDKSSLFSNNNNNHLSESSVALLAVSDAEDHEALAHPITSVTS